MTSDSEEYNDPSSDDDNDHKVNICSSSKKKSSTRIIKNTKRKRIFPLYRHESVDQKDIIIIIESVTETTVIDENNGEYSVNQKTRTLTLAVH